MRAHAYNIMSPFLALFDLVGVLARRRHQLADAEFAALGLSHTEARLLTLLHDEGGVASQEALTQMVTIDRTNAGRALLRLEQQGFVQRSKHHSDGRAKLVSLSERGDRAVLEIRRLRDQIATTLFGDLSEEEAQSILNVLDRALSSARADKPAIETAKDGPNA